MDVRILEPNVVRLKTELECGKKCYGKFKGSQTRNVFTQGFDYIK